MSADYSSIVPKCQFVLTSKSVGVFNNVFTIYTVIHNNTIASVEDISVKMCVSAYKK